MIDVICTNKVKSGRGNKVVAYEVVNVVTGEHKVLNIDSLKQLIRDRKINVLNMTLTSTNRLIRKEVRQMNTDLDKICENTLKELLKHVDNNLRQDGCVIVDYKRVLYDSHDSEYSNIGFELKISDNMGNISSGYINVNISVEF